MGGRCALWPSGDAHRPSRSTAGAATSFGLAAPFACCPRAARAVTLAIPQSEGLLRVRGRVCLRTTRPRPLGVASVQLSLRGKAVRAPLPGGGGPVGRPLGRRVGRHRRARTGTRPVTARRGLPARDCWMGATPQRRGGWAVRPHPPRRRSRHAEMGGRSHPRPRSADQHRRSAGRGATEGAPAT